MKIIIQENQKGLLFKNGKFVKVLDAGKYYVFGDKEIRLMNIADRVEVSGCTPEILLKNESVVKETVCADVSDRQLALHFVDGKFCGALKSGKYIYWKAAGEHSFKFVDISTPMVDESIPEYIFSMMSSFHYTKVEVKEYEKARLSFNRRFVRLLDPGTYYFWNTDTRVDIDRVDTRLTRMDINGQELLTRDKVNIRINAICNYRISDYVRIATEVDDYEEQIRVAAQLALREYVGKYALDEILENKEQMSEHLFARLKEKEAELFVVFSDVGVRDIILPGEIREIMNTVLLAEKRAQANVITRREEVASTRSLLNTARMMEENQTLYKLKELEYIERICDNIGNITLNSGGDILTQLMSLLKAK